MADAVPVTQRIVPGAPPPQPLSKSQKKKRKTGKGKDDEPAVDAILDLPTPRSAALIPEAPSEPQAANGIVSGQVAPSLVASNEDKDDHVAGEVAETKKPSPSVEAIAKKLKSITKKIQRIASYAHLPAAQLNEDQRRTAATLPALELTAKELEELKKAVEAIEADKIKQDAQLRVQEEETVKQRIAEAVSEAQVASISVASRVVAFIRLSHVVTSEPSITTASLSESERNAILVAAQYLLGESAEQRETVVAGFFSGTGEIEGIDYSRLRQILDDHLSEPAALEPTEAPRSPSPVAADGEPVPDDLHIPSAEVVPPASGTGSFHFMQASELEGASFEQGAEWVEKPEETIEPVVENGLVASYETAPVDASTTEPVGSIDWANDDGGLPEIESLQAKFGSSGQATPSIPQEAPAPETWTPAQEPVADPPTPPTTNGHNVPVPAVDDDGFTEARRPRTVGSRGGDRGFRGRGFRGGDRGGPRGGRPDGDRGRGGFRGGDRGGRGGGEYRGGEYRGRGRGGDRGGYRGRGAAPAEV